MDKIFMDPRIWMQQIWHTDEVKETVFNVLFSYEHCLKGAGGCKGWPGWFTC